MPRVRVIATGGTIANTSHGLIGVDEVLADVPQARELADFEVVEATRVRSGSIRLEHWLDVARAAADAADDPRVDAVLITHGTFTVEETAFFVHLGVRTGKPLVCVASQRKHGDVGNDGDRNLLDAIRVALCPEAAGKGALLVLHEEIHSAREVIKTNQRPGGFASPDCGILGHVEDDQVSFYHAPLRRHTARSEFDVRAIRELPRVDVVAAYVGADDAAARACVAAGARGLVVHGYTYSGRPSAEQLEPFTEIGATLPVVLASRGGRGRIPVLDEGPFVHGDSLVAQKARILLMLGLTRTDDRRELQRMFSEY